jgi:hypothetical protein
MACSHVHDFITGTTIALPRPSAAPGAEREIFDILHPSQIAAALVARHTAALEALGGRHKRRAAGQTSPVC